MLSNEKRVQVLGVLCNFGIDWLIESLKSNLPECENFDTLQQAQAAFNGARVIAEVAGLDERLTRGLINLLGSMEHEHWQDNENELKAFINSLYDVSGASVATRVLQDVYFFKTSYEVKEGKNND